MIVACSLLKITEIVNGTLVGSGNITINQVLIDSRKAIGNDNLLFVAIRGVNHNGHDFVGDLISKGVCNFIVDSSFSIAEIVNKANFIIVHNTLDALQSFAAYQRIQINYPILGITGSNGKTIVKEWISQLTGDSLIINKSPKSFNSQVGVPLSLFMFEQQSDFGIVEAGISRMGEMERLKRIIQPNWGLITNIGQAHQENFFSVDEKLNEKVKLLSGCEKIFFNIDDGVVYSKLKTACVGSELISWGRNNDADLIVNNVLIADNQTIVRVGWKMNNYRLIIPFIDNASFENAMHALLIVLSMGVDIEKVLTRMAGLKPVAMRLEQKEGRRGCLIINDTYNSDITSLELALDFLKQQARRNEMQRMVVLSDLFQSGLPKRELYQRISNMLSSYHVDHFIGVGSDLFQNRDLFGEQALFFKTTESLIESDLLNGINNRVILLKGSRDFMFEQITELLELKQHQTVLEINLNALRTNLNAFRQMLKPNVKLLAMVKAFSYGSGSFEIAGVLQHQHVDYLGVAFADEGRELRQSGINLPILVLSPEKRSFMQMIQYKLEPEIYSFKILKQFSEAVKNEGISSYPVHIKIDTGMRRLGFLPDEIPQLIKELNGHSHIKIMSIFSHLAGSEDQMHDSFTGHQIETFKFCCDQIIQNIDYPVLRHILNSAGIERFPEAQFEMVRLGIGLYGISSIENSEIQNIATLKSYISQIKPIDFATTVGYGRRGRLATAGKIAIIPIGYADGLDRRLGNGNGEFLIQGKLVKTVGNICMDMCMVDVTHINCEEEDEVIIFGEQLPIIMMAEKMGTIPYEVLTSIGRRVKRIYYQE
ncbi:MAG: bifunctional UDP-N-acetylmuramoyl-tripeptide:D-alanyl-D-alanine ligase/alanine racemase [Marinilabiliaceae bacterium]|nr:bifunctional UDP-N-acetylmuramoyl-tripeptide:D-alanyl-D-alanine ligase/alanine racemase [Marinilabiliaceae bacterium]